SKKDIAFSMHVLIVDSSFMEGITMETIGMHSHITYHYIYLSYNRAIKWDFYSAVYYLEL
ncbi:MAG: hypothetical protein AB7U21_02645, partial [Methanomethylovorans sp.]